MFTISIIKLLSASIMDRTVGGGVIITERIAGRFSLKNVLHRTLVFKTVPLSKTVSAQVKQQR